MHPRLSRGKLHVARCGEILDNTGMAERTEISIRLKMAMDAAGIGEKALVKKIGAGGSYVRDILYGRSKNPQGAKLRAAADALNVDVDWLLGAGPRELIAKKNGGGFAEPAQASAWTPPERREGDNRPSLDDLLRALCPPDARPAYLKASATLPAIGIIAGDLVVIDLKRPPRRGEIVTVQRVDEETASAVTVFRRWLDPILVPPEPSLAIEAELGRPEDCRPVIAVIRAPEIANPDNGGQ